jgi:putative DNA primase/helicase
MKNNNTPPTLDTCRAALSCCPAECDRETWLKLGMALHSEYPGADGFAVFDDWSSKAENYSARATRDVWRSFKPGAVKIGTLFAIAKDHGFTFDAVQTPAPKPTPADLKARAEARRAAAEREQAETAERQRLAAAEAVKLWASAADVTDPAAAPYLQRKGVMPYGVRCLPDGTLIVPARTAAGELVNVQRIAPVRPKDGPDKLFLKGARKAGTLHLIGMQDAAGELAPGPAWLLVGEGYATCASVHEATGRPVAVAWDAGNLSHVVRALRGRFPAARLALCADDDRATEARTGKNPGRLKAAEAARLAGKGRALVILPEGLPADGSGGSDFNDLHARAGLAAVRDVIERALADADKRTPEKRPPGAAGAVEHAAHAADEETAPAGRQRAAQGTGKGKRKGNTADDADTGTGPRDRYRIDDDGLWFDPPGDDAGDARPMRICGPLIVEALARDAHDNGAALLLQFDTPFRAGRRWPMPLSMLAGDGAAYRAELLNQGFMVPTDAKRRALLTAYLQSRQPAELVRTVDRVGWHGRAYVLPRETLGDGEGERILFQTEGATEGTFDQRGTHERWHELIGRHCVGNSRLGFFASLAFAGPLLAWASGTDGGGFHLVGDSSCGKTTALRVAASVWGGRDYLQRWRATDNGLESLAAQHSDGLLCLDELAQLDAKVAGESAYMLANGQGKSRAGRTGAARPRATWRLLFASAGEIGLAEHMNEAGKRTRAGQELRMIDMPADAGAGRGLFEDVGDFEGPGALAQHLTRATEGTFGTAGRAWLWWLVDHTEGLTRTLRERMDATERELVPEAAAGQVQRVGRRFALVAVAGELATEAGVTGWPAGTATEAARRCFGDWLAVRRGGVGLSEEAEILRQVRQWVQAHGFSARCPRTDRADDDRAPQAINQAGWRKPLETDAGLLEVEAWEWFLYPEVFAAEVCKGLPGGDRAALRLLAARGHLAREGKHYACRRSVRGVGKLSVYVIKSSILDDTED